MQAPADKNFETFFLSPSHFWLDHSFGGSDPIGLVPVGELILH